MVIQPEHICEKFNDMCANPAIVTGGLCPVVGVYEVDEDDDDLIRNIRVFNTSPTM